MQSESNVVLSYFGDPEATAKRTQEVRESISQFEITHSFINNTHRDITVVTRLGLPFSVPHTHSGTNSNFIIRVKYFFRHAVKDKTKRLLERVNTNSPTELRILKEALEATPQTGYMGGESVTIDYEVSERELIEMGGSVYHHATDFVLSVVGVDRVPSHPGSSLGLGIQEKRKSRYVNEDVSFGYQVDIIDNTGRSCAFFINFNNTVWNVRPRKDPTREDGIYILSDAESIGTVKVNDKIYRKLPLDAETALQHGLYQTYADALALGDVVTQRKKDLLDMEYQLKASQHDNAMMKIKHDGDMRELDRELRESERKHKEADLLLEKRSKELAAQIDITSHLMTMERVRFKDSLDVKAAERKDYSEALKYIPMVVVAIGAIAAAVKGTAKK